jgi:cytochrome b561
LPHYSIVAQRKAQDPTYGTRTGHYPATSKLLHWLIAACVLTTAPVAIAMTRVGKGPTQLATQLFTIHRWVGCRRVQRLFR